MAEYQTESFIDAVEEGVLEDIKKAKECGIEAMLRAMLRIIAHKTHDSTENKEWAEACLQQCLDATTSFVNEDNNYTKKLQSGLKAYCDGVLEVDRYPGMVLALNAIILQFRSNHNQMALPSELRIPEDKLEAMFKVNDPVIIDQDQSRANSCQPDIIQLNCKTLAKLNRDDNSYDDFEATIFGANNNESTQLPAMTEDKRLQWGDMFSTFELKRRYLLMDYGIPRRYEHERLTHENTLPPLKPPGSGYEDDSPSPLSSSGYLCIHPNSHQIAPGNVTLTKLGRTDSLMEFGRQELKSLTAMGQTRSSMATGSASPITASSSPAMATTVSSSPQSPTGHRKRRLDQVTFEFSDSKRVRRTPPLLHPVVKSAIYAAERLSTGAWIKCAVSVILLDVELYVTLYDRQSPLAARGFNFIEHLPHFVVLILILQRLQSCQWDMLALPPAHDVDEGMTRLFKIEGQMAIIRIDEREFKFNMANALTLHALNGRGTTGVPVEEVKQAGGIEAKNPQLFLKISWPESICQRENKIIEKIKEVSKEYPAIADHTPNLLAFETFTIHSTRHIRTLLGFGLAEVDCSRVLCCGVYEKLQPITMLEGLEFWKAYWEIITTHYMLWQRGIEHGDISISNLMYRIKDGVPKGVLNDFDLARLTINGKCKSDQVNDRTGTIPFMAIDLLSPEAGEGRVRHLYRHDLESFAWVLFWVISCYDKGKELTPRPKPFADWNFSASITSKEKHAFLSEYLLNQLQSWRSINSAATLILMFWKRFYYLKTRALAVKAALQNQHSFTEEESEDSVTEEGEGKGDLLPEEGEGDGDSLEEENFKLLSDLFSFLAKSHEGLKLSKRVRAVLSFANPDNHL